MDADKRRCGLIFMLWIRIVYSTRCDETLRDTSGTIQSPGYPTYAGIFSECYYIFEIDYTGDFMINVTFEEVQFPCDGSDQLQVFTTRSKKITVCTGNTTTSFFLDSEGYLQFRSLNDSKSVRFQAHYFLLATSGDTTKLQTTTSANTITRSVGACGGTLYGDTGTITSPNYPGSYPHNLNCIWTVNETRDTYITIHFTSFGIVCPGDTITIYDGEKNPNKTLIYGKCGISVAGEIGTLISTASVVYVEFITDSSGRSSGFSLTWTANSTKTTESTTSLSATSSGAVDACGSSLYGDTGTITSPNYPDSYPHNLNCTWKVNGARDTYIMIQFTHFDTVCPGDTVTIYDWEVRYDKTMLNAKCGIGKANEIGTLTSTASVVYIEFITDSSSRSTGFSLTWTVSEPKTTESTFLFTTYTTGIKTESTPSTLKSTEYTDSLSVTTNNIDSTSVTTANTESTRVECTSVYATTIHSPTTERTIALVVGSTVGGFLAGIIIGITVTSLFCIRRSRSLYSKTSKEDETETKPNRDDTLPMSHVASGTATRNNTETYESLVNADNTMSSDQYTPLNINHIAVATRPTAGNSKGIYEPLVDAGNTTSSDQYTPLDFKDKTSDANIGGSFAYANEMMSTANPQNDMVNSDMVTVGAENGNDNYYNMKVKPPKQHATANYENYDRLKK